MLHRAFFSDISLPRSPAAAVRAEMGRESELSALPEWRLTDLYSGMDAPRFAADLRSAAEQAKKFSEDYRGKLNSLVKGPGGAEALAEAVRRYEAIQDLVGR